MAPYFIASLDKKWNDILSARDNANGTLLGITPVLDSFHKPRPITLTLEFGVHGNRPNLHHTIVCHRPHTT